MSILHLDMQRIRHRNKRCCQRQFRPNFCHTYCDNIFFHLGRHTDNRQGIGLLQNENFVSTYFHKVWNPYLWYISKILILHVFFITQHQLVQNRLPRWRGYGCSIVTSIKYVSKSNMIVEHMTTRNTITFFLCIIYICWSHSFAWRAVIVRISHKFSCICKL